MGREGKGRERGGKGKQSPNVFVWPRPCCIHVVAIEVVKSRHRRSSRYIHGLREAASYELSWVFHSQNKINRSL